MDPFSLVVLHTYSTRVSLSLVQLGAILDISPLDLVEIVDSLRHEALIQVSPSYPPIAADGLIPTDLPFVITMKGRGVLETDREKRKHFKYNEFREWAAIGIALIALAVSIIALLKQ